MSILFVTTHDRIGGAEQVILSLAQNCSAEYRTEVAIVYGSHDGDLSKLLKKPLLGLREILFGKYDVIHTHLFLPGLLVRLRRIFDRKFKWIHTVHYQHDGLRFAEIKRKLDQSFIFPSADHLVSVSPVVHADIEHYPKAILIENGLRELRALPAFPPRFQNSPIVLGCMANFRPEKGLDLLIEALGKIVAEGQNFRLKLAGDGPELSHLRAIVDRLGLGEKVEFCGYVLDVEAFYHSIDIYVQPSLSESFGLALWDALQCHLPVVGNAVGNIPQLLAEGQFGRLVPGEGDLVDNLVIAIKEVSTQIEDYRTRSMHGHTFFKDRFAPERMIARYRRLYGPANPAEKVAASRAPSGRPPSIMPAGANPAQNSQIRVSTTSGRRILMIAPVITHAMGGMQKQLLLQSKELVRRGYQVHLLQREDPGLADPERRKLWAHVKIHFLKGCRLGFGGGTKRTRSNGG